MILETLRNRTQTVVEPLEIDPDSGEAALFSSPVTYYKTREGSFGLTVIHDSYLFDLEFLPDDVLPQGSVGFLGSNHIPDAVPEDKLEEYASFLLKLSGE